MFKCRHPEKRNLVVVKQVRLGDSDTSRKALLEREIHFYAKRGKMMGRLIPRFEGEEGDAQGLHLCLEFIDRGSIKELTRQGSITQDLIVTYAGKVASALEYLHGNHIIWNGCCADHVLLDSRGRPRLISFGLSRKGSGELVKALRHADLEHRLRWLAPEAVQYLQYGQKTDIWAFGCFVVEMLTGRDPHYDCEKVEEVKRKLAHTVDPRPLVSYPGQAVIKAIPQLLDQAFMCEPAKRPTAAKIIASLALHTAKATREAHSSHAPRRTRIKVA